MQNNIYTIISFVFIKEYMHSRLGAYVKSTSIKLTLPLKKENQVFVYA